MKSTPDEIYLDKPKRSTISLSAALPVKSAFDNIMVISSPKIKPLAKVIKSRSRKPIAV